jgi:acetyl esterase/lipase
MTATPTRRRALGLALGLSAAASFPARAANTVEIAYGPHRLQRLDVYPRPGLKDAPVLVFVHGGGWSFGDKRAVNALPGYAERHGFLLVSVDYRLTPEVTARGCAEDVAAAVAWTLTDAGRYGGDPKRVFLVGHSAGAHLVALVGVDPTWLGAHGRAPGDLAGVIPLDGAGYDAPTQMRLQQQRRPGGGLLGGMYEKAFAAEPEALSPTLLVRTGRAYPPFLIFHVAARPDSRAQSQALAEALRGAGGRAEVIAAPGETHSSLNRGFGVAGDPEGERAATFIAGRQSLSRSD